MAYFPNGTAGMVLDDQCSACPIHDDQPCRVLEAHLFYNYDQFTDGKPNKVAEVLNTLVDKDGLCLMKPLIELAVKHPKTEDKPMLEDFENPRIEPMPAMREWARQHGLLQ